MALAQSAAVPARPRNPPKPFAACLSRRKGSARAIRNLRFVLGDGSYDVDRETVRLRKIHGFKFDLRLHQV
jgi:hypothetical protein